ncbi:DUF6542 domain-containing protein [Streptomyces diacarni]|uniref:DUF6542 domain-containing protein n=1 Tax=Streptomyces diacarni TaxID=2800381 RepID=UPI0015F06FDD|nr:DUF6542 domain-containing protein [Streptomyces diacarni]
MEQRSAHPTQHDPYELYGDPEPYEPPRRYGDEPRQGHAPADDAAGMGGGEVAAGSVRIRRRPRLPRPAAAPSSSPPPPPPSGRGGTQGDRPSAHRPAPSGEGAPAGARGALRGRRPAPRLTGLGVGVFAMLLMAAFGALVGLLPSGVPVAYGSAFVLVCVAAALWVRPAELFAAPVAMPLAYTVGLFLVGGSGKGVAGLLQDVFTGLALHAVWLYAGTLLAGLIVLVRKTKLALERRRRRRAKAPQGA